MGNWESYALWQFSAQANCGRARCPYRVPGTPNDIDVNVVPMDIAELREKWPFGGLIDAPADTLVSVPVPVARDVGLTGNFTITYAAVTPPPSLLELTAALEQNWKEVRDGWRMAATYFRTYAMAEAGSEKLAGPPPDLVQFADAPQGIDPILTGSIKAAYGPR